MIFVIVAVGSIYDCRCGIEDILWSVWIEGGRRGSEDK